MPPPFAPPSPHAIKEEGESRISELAPWALHRWPNVCQHRECVFRASLVQSQAIPTDLGDPVILTAMQTLATECGLSLQEALGDAQQHTSFTHLGNGVRWIRIIPHSKMVVCYRPLIACENRDQCDRVKYVALVLRSEAHCEPLTLKCGDTDARPEGLITLHRLRCILYSCPSSELSGFTVVDAGSCDDAAPSKVCSLPTAGGDSTTLDNFDSAKSVTVAEPAVATAVMTPTTNAVPSVDPIETIALSAANPTVIVGRYTEQGAPGAGGATMYHVLYEPDRDKSEYFYVTSLEPGATECEFNRNTRWFVTAPLANGTEPDQDVWGRTAAGTRPVSAEAMKAGSPGPSEDASTAPAAGRLVTTATALSSQTIIAELNEKEPTPEDIEPPSAEGAQLPQALGAVGEALSEPEQHVPQTPILTDQHEGTMNLLDILRCQVAHTSAWKLWPEGSYYSNLNAPQSALEELATDMVVVAANYTAPKSDMLRRLITARRIVDPSVYEAITGGTLGKTNPWCHASVDLSAVSTTTPGCSNFVPIWGLRQHSSATPTRFTTSTESSLMHPLAASEPESFGSGNGVPQLLALQSSGRLDIEPPNGNDDIPCSNVYMFSKPVHQAMIVQTRAKPSSMPMTPAAARESYQTVAPPPSAVIMPVTHKGTDMAMVSLAAPAPPPMQR